MSSARISKADRETLRQIRLVVFDFDGVFTDNAVWVSEDGKESVRCWRSDGLGLTRLKEIGITTMVLSTEKNPVVSARCKKLKIRCEQDISDKGQRLAGIARETGVPLAHIAYVGNDINDADCLRQAGMPIVVADAYPEVLPLARLKTSRPGGHGAVREICDLLFSLHSKQP